MHCIAWKESKSFVSLYILNFFADSRRRAKTYFVTIPMITVFIQVIVSTDMEEMYAIIILGKRQLRKNRSNIFLFCLFFMSLKIYLRKWQELLVS